MIQWCAPSQWMRPMSVGHNGFNGTGIDVICFVSDRRKPCGSEWSNVNIGKMTSCANLGPRRAKWRQNNGATYRTTSRHGALEIGTEAR